ncbi:LCP family protein [Streptomyces sp. V4-01]|uniref:LCP family protein n=1 Tax=Actinacidiphila polyblastidii TaxID=3110430 RepID=A0ABU7PEL1_9ACTN|nr:LCP family protein [Streptomyces sp. V4-01]
MPPTRRRPSTAAGRPGGPTRRPRRPPVRWTTKIAGGLALLVITASGLGHAVVNSLSGAIDRVDAFGGMQGRPDGTKGTNFLLVGTDGRDGLDHDEKQQYHLGGAPCHCTDTIMLVHLSADHRRASIVSIPRDSYVLLPNRPRPGASSGRGSTAPGAAAAAPGAGGATGAQGVPAAAGSADAKGAAASTGAAGSPSATATAAVTTEGTATTAAAESAQGAAVSARAASVADVAAGPDTTPPDTATPPDALDAKGAGAGPVEAGAPSGSAAPAAPAAAVAGGAPSPSADADTDAGSHPAKINEAYADGGPKLTVRTVERLTGVHIDHYLEVDFTSFMKTVDVIGGVPVCTTEPLTDSYTGLDLPAGTTRLDGGQALQYVRSRHIDGSADLGRMQRQQKFLAQVIHKITGSGVLGDPLELSRIATTVLGSVRADRGLTATDLISLAEGMKGFSPSSSEFVSVPLSDLDYRVPRIGSTVKWDEARAGRLWAAIRADRPLAQHRRASHTGARVDVDPATIRVTLANGTATNGLASAAQKALHATGFVTPGLPITAPQRVDRTEIRYDPRWDRSARSLGAALPGARLVPVPGQGAVMQVTLGADFTEVTPVTVRSNAVGEDAVTGDEVACP